jgi:hypothetical protein
VEAGLHPSVGEHLQGSSRCQRLRLEEHTKLKVRED